MRSRRGWISARMSLRLGGRRFLVTFPPNWNRWAVVWTAAVLLPIGYFLSAVPTIMALRRSGLYTPQVEQCALVFYAPLAWLEQRSPPFREFFEAEDRLIRLLLGE